MQIQSSTNLHDFGLLISNQLFGGIGFVHSESRDEIPCIQLDRPVLGLFAILAGIPPTFSLEIFTLALQRKNQNSDTCRRFLCERAAVSLRS